ncbi:MAG: putative quinol monooxygenase [Desulfobacterales bacterium]
MAEDKVTVVATFKAKTGLEKKVKQAIQALIAPTRAEAGCINYDLHQSTDDPSLFILYENWVSKQALDTHLAMPYLEEFLGKADTLLKEPVDIALWKMISTPAQ